MFVFFKFRIKLYIANIFFRGKNDYDSLQDYFDYSKVKQRNIKIETTLQKYSHFVRNRIILSEFSDFYEIVSNAQVMIKMSQQPVIGTFLQFR